MLVLCIAHKHYTNIFMFRHYFLKLDITILNLDVSILDLGVNIVRISIICLDFNIARCLVIIIVLVLVLCTHINITQKLLCLDINILYIFVSILDLGVSVLWINSIYLDFNVDRHLIIIIALVLCIVHECHTNISMSRHYYSKYKHYYPGSGH